MISLHKIIHAKPANRGTLKAIFNDTLKVVFERIFGKYDVVMSKDQKVALRIFFSNTTFLRCISFAPSSKKNIGKSKCNIKNGKIHSYEQNVELLKTSILQVAILSTH